MAVEPSLKPVNRLGNLRAKSCFQVDGRLRGRLNLALPAKPGGLAKCREQGPDREPGMGAKGPRQPISGGHLGSKCIWG